MNRILPIVFMLSLVANAVCIAAWWRASRATSAPAAMPPAAAVHGASRPAFDAQTAARLKADDLREYAARLRQAGFPGDIVRAIILAQLSENNEPRRRALPGTPDAVNYWKQSRRSPADEKALRELRREESRRLREALGADAESPETAAYNREAPGLATLPAEKAERVRELARERDEKREDMSAINGYNFNDSAALEREFRNAVRRELTAKEFFEFELRTSNIARSLREQLAGIDVTEDEFRAIYSQKAVHDEQFEPARTSRDPGIIAARERAEATLREQIRLQLGAERAAEFERMEDYDYRRTTDVVARLGLPRETAAQISAVQKEITQRRGDIVRAHNADKLGREAMMTQLRELQQEATKRLTPLLRDTRGFEAYQTYTGRWIGNLVPVR